MVLVGSSAFGVKLKSSDVFSLVTTARNG